MVGRRNTPVSAIEHVEALVHLFNEDRERWLATLPDGVVVETDPAWPDGGRLVGCEAVAEFIREFDKQWASMRFEIDALEEIGPAVVTKSRWVVVGMASGVPTEMGFSVVFLMLDSGRLASAHFFFDDGAARDYARSLGG